MIGARNTNMNYPLFMSLLTVRMIIKLELDISRAKTNDNYPIRNIRVGFLKDDQDIS